MHDRPLSWIRKTGQTWKLVVFGILLSGAGILMLDFVLHLQMVGAEQRPISIILIGIGLGLGAFFWLAVSIRCPSCRKAAAYVVLRTAEANNWFVVLWGLDRCPSCEFRPPS